MTEMSPLGTNILNHFEENLKFEHHSFTLPSGNDHAHVAKGQK